MKVYNGCKITCSCVKIYMLYIVMAIEKVQQILLKLTKMTCQFKTKTFFLATM